MDECVHTIDLQNSTSNLYYYVYFPNEWIVFWIIWPMLIFVGLVGNISFIFTVSRVPALQTSTYIYLVSLAFMDLLTIIVRPIRNIVPYFTNQLRWTVSTNSTYDVLSSVVTSVCYSVSIGLIFIVTLERFLAICHPIKHYLLKSTRRTYKLIACVNMLSLLISVSSRLIWMDTDLTVITICFVWPINGRFSSFPKQVAYNEYTPKPYQKFLNIVYFLYHMICFTFTCFMLAKIQTSLKKRRCNTTFKISSKFDQDLHQIGVMVVANGIVYLICFSVTSLYQLFDLLYLFGYDNFFEDMEYHYVIWSHFVAFSIAFNAVINPIIYVTCNRNYRVFLKATLLNCCCLHSRI